MPSWETNVYYRIVERFNSRLLNRLKSVLSLIQLGLANNMYSVRNIMLHVMYTSRG